jgi:hypothetical protein
LQQLSLWSDGQREQSETTMAKKISGLASSAGRRNNRRASRATNRPKTLIPPISPDRCRDNRPASGSACGGWSTPPCRRAHSGGQMFFELRHALLVEGSERLIENPQRRAVQIQARQRHATLLTGGQGCGRERLRNRAILQLPRPARSPRAWRLMQGAEPGKVLFRGQQVLDPGGMADPQQIACELRCVARSTARHSAIPDRLVGCISPAEQAQQTGFAAAVGATDLHHIATGQSQFEIFEEQPKVSLTGKGNGLQDRTGQGITGLIRFKSALERPLKRCSIDAMAA